MSEYAKLAASAGDQYLAALAESQETFLKAMAPYAQWTAQLPKMPSTGFAADLPTPLEIVEANFAFTGKLLKQQKKFFEKLFETPQAAS